MEPKTYKEGPLPAKTTEKILNERFDLLQELLGAFDLCQGTVSIQMVVAKNGSVKKIGFGTNTLTDLFGRKTAALNKQILKLYTAAEFPSAQSETQITLPLIFR